MFERFIDEFDEEDEPNDVEFRDDYEDDDDEDEDDDSYSWDDEDEDEDDDDGDYSYERYDAVEMLMDAMDD